jgi:hypothetical protein
MSKKEILIYKNNEIINIQCVITNYPTLGLYDSIIELNNELDNKKLSKKNIYIIGIVYTQNPSIYPDDYNSNNINISDFQPNISESQINFENSQDIIYRGILEELQIDINKNILQKPTLNIKKNNYQVNHFICEINDMDFKTDIENIIEKKGYNNRKKKSSIILYGYKETLIKILKNWNPIKRLQSEKHIYCPCLICADNLINP